MSLERPTRRKILQLAGAGMIATSVPETVTRVNSLLVARDRGERPLMLENIPDDSVAFGLAPHNNSLEFALRTGETLGKRPHLAGFFIHNSQPFSENPHALQEVRAATEAGLIVELNWGGVMGHVDLSQLVNELSWIGADFLWRPWYEMNGRWTQSWYGGFTPAEFVGAWGAMWTYFQDHLPSAKFVFCPNATNIADRIEPYFPGEDRTHLVSLDGYLKHRFNPFDSRHYVYPYLSPEELLGPDIATLQQLAPKVPFIQSEINTALEPEAEAFLFNRILPLGVYGRGEWLARAVAYLVRCGARAWLSFDWYKASFGQDEDDWALIEYPSVVERISGELSKSYYLSGEVETGAEKTWTKLLTVR